ncbi:Protein of unknown function [Blastococcus aggregatus]|uniref:DUF2510 domain-containing protein n=1 Tax=Blastococcus aggregatus TaxID=38502 RepID=A0A285V8N4_9ACTN|nr:DUF2510 domain-containing protein [Blastococcus aggregatus]SOC48851.1 Protein of unknown function [Blastococcus aggregatus]
MTSSGQPTPPPGWYADPDGTPGMVRWWSGSAWSDVATPAGPGVAVQSSPSAPQRTAVQAPWTPAPGPAPRRPRRAAWVAAGVVGLVLAVVLALVVGTGGEDDAVAGRDPLPSTGQSPSGPSFAPGTVRIVDEEAGIAYPYLGTGWLEYGLAAMPETTAVAGQYFTTQEDTPVGQFIAQVTSGPVAEGYGWSGPGTQATTVAALADSVRGNYYPQPNERRILRDEATTVDGRAAHVLEFQLAWDVEGYDASGERAALLLIDVGRPAPALLYISIPNTHAELYGVIDRLIAAVEVL